MENILGQESHH